jgi:hypothetical protein
MVPNIFNPLKKAGILTGVNEHTTDTLRTGRLWRAFIITMVEGQAINDDAPSFFDDHDLCRSGMFETFSRGVIHLHSVPSPAVFLHPTGF